MNLDDYTKERIDADVENLKYLYRLKQVIRYDEERTEEDNTESVAEHLYGMNLLVQYFLPLEDPERKLNRARIYEIITVHDLDEIITGDYLSYVKNESHHKEAEEAFVEVKKHIPEHISASVISLLDEYAGQETPESRFVKAIDKAEPLVQVYNDHGKMLCHRNRCTAEDSLGIKVKYIDKYPFIKKFCMEIHGELITGGYYWEGDK